VAETGASERPLPGINNLNARFRTASSPDRLSSLDPRRSATHLNSSPQSSRSVSPNAQSNCARWQESPHLTLEAIIELTSG